MTGLLSRLALLPMVLTWHVSMAATESSWVDALADRLSDKGAERLDDKQVSEYFEGLLRVSEVFPDTCNPLLSIKSDHVPLLGAIGALGHVATCQQVKPLIFVRLQVAAPVFDSMKQALTLKLPRPCFSVQGSKDKPAMTVWADTFRFVGVTSGRTPSDGFTVFFESRATGPSADPEGEAALRQDIEADIPTSCK